jgi:3-hydroxybutyrate dehydrogenase|uniref:3-hydroxybutyrate dehydrogenase n=1 Tax=Polynucleobacter sp. TaxID=2029855 RepID=UPI0040489678
MSHIKGKTALVTGSTSGIGLAIATALAKQGANIMLNGFGEIELAKAHIKATGVEVDYHGADMSKPTEIQDLIQKTEARFGSVDILVNNAGIQHVSNIEDFPADKWESIIAINLSSAFYTSHHALPGMQKRNWGRIINIASVHGLVASTQKAAYVAAKHGIIGLTKVTALENAKTGITCNAICPGWVLTPLVQKQVDARAEREHISNEEAKNALVSEKQPSGEFVAPEQLAALAVFLCGPDASEVRGAAWNMDGGWTAQ